LLASHANAEEIVHDMVPDFGMKSHHDVEKDLLKSIYQEEPLKGSHWKTSLPVGLDTSEYDSDNLEEEVQTLATHLEQPLDVRHKDGLLQATMSRLCFWNKIGAYVGTTTTVSEDVLVKEMAFAMLGNPGIQVCSYATALYRNLTWTG
jgi:hypothetical protein